MNKSYRIVWNHVRNCLMVVSEATKAKGKAVASKEAVLTTVAAAVMALGAQTALATNTEYIVPGGPVPSGYVYGQTLTLGSGDSLLVNNTGSVSGTATGANGVFINGITTGTISSTLYSISNAGTINSFSKIAVALAQATLSGGIMNTGSLGGGSKGISAIHSMLSGSIVNSGSIGGTNVGIYVSQSTVVGGIINTGMVTTSGYAGIAVYNVGGLISGGVTNSGSIGGGTYGIVVSNAQLSGGIRNSSAIQGLSGIGLNAGRLNGGITNSSLISGTSIAGIKLAANSTVNGGIQNLVGGTISGGANGVYVYQNSALNGGITNAGLIEGLATAGIAVLANVSGGIQNLAGSTISGGSYGINIGAGGSISGGITNSGVIQGSAKVGVFVSAGSLSGGITNLTGATIAGYSVGIYINNQSTLTGGITNSGYIVASSSSFLGISDAIHIQNSMLSGGIQNLVGGTVTSFGDAVKVNSSQITGGITNAGMIHSTAANSINLANATLIGGISNMAGGVMSADYNGIILSHSTVGGGINNSGTISGARGIFAYNSSALFGGINNFAGGTIVGSLYGIEATAGGLITGGLTNSGLISGGTDSIYVSSNSSLDRIVIAGNNTASFSGLVYAPNTPVTVAGGATYTLNSNFQVSNFDNQGTLIAPVASVATPTITGNLTLGSTGTFSPTVASQSGYSQITVSGTVSVAGSLMVNAQLISALTAGSTLTGVITGNALTGTFSRYSDNSVLYNFIPVYSGTALGLAVTNSGACYGTLTSNKTGPCLVGYDAPQLVTAGYSITGGTVGIEVLAGNITNSGSGVGITNTGLISGNLTGIQLQTGSTLQGSIVNQGRIVAQGITGGGSTAGIALKNATLGASIVNTGSVYGGYYGVDAFQSSIAGGINNSGTIQTGNAGYAGIEVAFSFMAGNINNSGSINSAQYGVIISTFSTIAGGFTNTGTILGGSGAGILITRGSLISSGINNSGKVSASGTGGIVMYTGLVHGGITNTGSIAGGSNGIFLSNSIISGGISNLAGGIVSGSGIGVLLTHSTVTGGITNAAIISGSGPAGISVQSGSLLSGGINNLAGGTISGQNNGINIYNGSVTGGITNSGLIAGGYYAIAVLGSLDNIAIAGNNTASFSGLVYAPNTPVTVVGGATYTLNSNFSVSNFDNQGTLIAPVASVATPTITGNLTLGSSGTFSPTVASQSSTTHITVTGSVSLAGNLAVNAAAVTTMTVGTTLTGIITGNTVTGTFAHYSDNSVLYDFQPLYTGTMLDLVVVANSAGNTIYSVTQQQGNTAGLGSARVLDQIGNLSGVMGGVTTAFGQMSSNAQISNAVSQTLPVMSGATTLDTLSVLSSINHIIEARHLQNQGISSGESFYGDSNVWLKPFGSWMNQGNSNGAYGFKANTGGLMIGGDTVVNPDTRLGLAVAWGNSSAQSNAGVAPQTQSSNLYQFIGYGSYALTDTLEANFQGNGGWNNNTSSRQLSFMNTSAQGSYSSAVWHVGAGLANPYTLSEATQLIPSLRYDYSWIRNNGYNETGASNGLGLNVNAQTYQTSVVSMDGKLVQKLDDHNSVNANLGVGYNFSPTQTSVVAAFQGAQTLQFTTNGVNPGAVMGHAGVGYVYKVKENVDVGIRYDIDFQSSYTNQIATAKARWSF